MQTFRNNPSKQPSNDWIGGISLVLLLTIAGARLGRVFPEWGALNSDAYWTYLPNARGFLEAPWTFLTTNSASYHVAPLGYMWPALWGGDQHITQIANCALFLVSILLIWSFARRFGGTLAAVVACVILIGHPDIKDHAAQVLTESIYLFGFSLSLFALGNVLTQPKKYRWLGLLSLGLTITLLTRPVLQYMLLLTLFISIGLGFQKKFKQPARALSLALLLSFVLPAATVVKNGIYFDVWSIGTGSGSGLFYGLSPHRRGAEPVYSNFTYDANAIPYVLAPSTQGHPLDKHSDALNQSAALEIAKRTHWQDNATFFMHKLRMWLFTSTPELYINPKLRWIRLFEWLTIAFCMGLIAVNRIRGTPLNLPGTGSSNHQKLLLFGGLLIGVLMMAVQLTPVLYNTRYASYFIEPWLLILTGWSVSYILKGNLWPLRRALQWPTGVAFLILLISAAHALTQHAVRRERWEIDPRRPGPTEVVIPASKLRSIQGEGMKLAPAGEWVFNQNPGILRITLSNEPVPDHTQVQDAIWRMRFALHVPGKPSSQCVKARLDVAPNQPSESWYVPPPLIFVQADGQAHHYMISANGASRPVKDAEISLTFHCPAGSRLTWHGMELRQSTLIQEAITFLSHGKPINPYLDSSLESDQ